MGEIHPKECEPRELTKDQLAAAWWVGAAGSAPGRGGGAGRADQPALSGLHQEDATAAAPLPVTETDDV